jgi:hypothetical protein
LSAQSRRCTTGGIAAHDRGDTVTNRTDAALTRRVTAARLVTVSAVLGGTLALAGLGAFGGLVESPAEGDVGPGIVTVELSQAVSHR